MDKSIKYRQIVCQYLEDFAAEDPEAELIFDLERDRLLNGASAPASLKETLPPKEAVLLQVGATAQGTASLFSHAR